MKMTSDWADLVQERLQIMVFGPDDYSPVAFIGGVISKEYERTQWQEGVDMIYRLLKIGILLLLPHGAIKTDEDVLDFSRALAEQNPFTITGEAFIRDWGCPWMDPLLSASDLCVQLMRKHGINNFDTPLCEAFIEEIEALFDTAGIPWSEAPLIPIRFAKS